jgi:hypothetical protein
MDVLSITMRIAPVDTRDFFRLWTGELVDVHMPNGRKPGLEALQLPYHDGARYARSYPRPMPGVWEVAINNATPGLRYAEVSRTPLPPTHYIFSATAIGVRVLEKVKLRQNAYRIELLNTGAPMHPLSTTTPLGIAQTSTIVLSSARPRMLFPIRVPPKTAEVRVEVTALTPTSTEMQIALFNCAKNIPAQDVPWVYQGPCELKATGEGARSGIATTTLPEGGEGQIARLEPTPVPGRWIAVVEAANVRNPLTLRVRCIVTSPIYGTVTTMSPHVFLANGQRWKVTVVVRPLLLLTPDSWNIAPIITSKEAETISEKLPLSENGSVLLNTKPVVIYSRAPIWIGNMKLGF